MAHVPNDRGTRRLIIDEREIFMVDKHLPEEASEDTESLSSVLCYLLKRSGETIPRVAAKIGVSDKSLYTIKYRSVRVDIKLLKKIADYFHEDVSIFCGLKSYKPPVKLSQREEEVVELLRKFEEADKERVLRIISGMAQDPEQMTFIEKYSSLSDKPQERVRDVVEDAVRNTDNLRQSI